MMLDQTTAPSAHRSSYRPLPPRRRRRGAIAIVVALLVIVGAAALGLLVHQLAFDDADPAIANLNPELRDALARATSDAEREGIHLVVNSGWRSAELQQQLLDDAIAQYGSAEEAARWVADPTSSAHVTGDAVDIVPAEAAVWLSERGAAYGLCQIYANEPWHFEFRAEAVGAEPTNTEAVDGGCPEMYADPTEDPTIG